MKRLTLVLLACLAALAVHAAPLVFAVNPAWTQPHKPFRIYGDTYYVGTEGLSSILITSPGGHILIDGTLPQNVKLIEANIRALGFRVEDVRVILNSHAHFDHAGAIAALAHDSGATVRASASGAHAMALGGLDPEDPQFRVAPAYPVVKDVKPVADGEIVRVGDLAVTAHATPGHTPGGTSWTWRACENGVCKDMVYADSLSALGNEGYRFTDDAKHPHRVEDFRKSFDTIAALPCDRLMVTHPDAIDFLDKAAAHDAGKVPDPLADPNACRAYADAYRAKFEARLAKEKTAP
jgi:metallo-beta-lactamase class B